MVKTDFKISVEKVYIPDSPSFVKDIRFKGDEATVTFSKDNSIYTYSFGRDRQREFMSQVDDLSGSKLFNLYFRNLPYITKKVQNKELNEELV